MKNDPSQAKMNRRLVLRGAGSLMLGLPLLEAFMPRNAAAQDAMRSPFVIIVVNDNGVVQAGVTLGVQGEPERFWPSATGPLTKESLLADKPTRAMGELSDYADRLLVIRGINLPYGSTGCSHSAADAQILTSAQMSGRSTECVSTRISVDTAIATAMNPAGRGPLALHAGMFRPNGTGFDIPGYVSYVAPNQPRTYIDSPLKAYEAIIGVVGTSGGNPEETEAQRLRALRSKSVNDLLRPQMQALLARNDLSTSDRLRLDQHFTAIRDIEAAIPMTDLTVSQEEIDQMEQIDRDAYNQSSYEARIKLNMRLMAFSAAADYTKAAVLKIGDRIDDHVFNINGQSFKFHDASHRTGANAIDLHHACDRLFANHYKYLLDLLTSYTTPTGPLLDQGIAVWTNQCATGAHSFSNVPWILAGTANGLLKKGQFLQVGTGVMPGGGQDGKAGDPSVSGVNKMLNTLLTAAGVTKAGGAPTDDFGDPSLPKGIFSELFV
jgi:hypothetical protein